jgi:uncharacterized heparinase superfamily protein
MRDYLRQLRTHPPAVIWRKVTRRMARNLRDRQGRLRARWSSPVLTDAALLRALGGRFAKVQDYLAHLAQRPAPHFFFTPAEQKARVALLRTCCPHSETLTIAAADQVCQHIFDLLGSGPTPLGPRIDWHVDFKSGHRWDPRQYYSDVRPAPYPGGYDLKVPWELSRCQHFAWLGQAYWLTGDERYPGEFVAQVSDWLAQNPPPWGVNWGCTMDVAIRVVNWLWGYAFCQSSPALTAEFRLAFHKSLLQHGRHIRQNLEYSETLTSNHYLSNLVGLVYLGVLLPEFPEAAEWRAFGLRELEQEMFKQVYADGIDFEASTNYHRMVTEFFLSATLLAERNGHGFSPTYLARLEGMVAAVLHLTQADGTTPLIGDVDNGRLHRLKAWGGSLLEWSDFRHLLAIGAVRFQRADFAQAAGDQWEEASWIWGKEALAAQAASGSAQTAARSQAFAEAGWYVIRHGEQQALVSAGPNGQLGNGGHAHNDKLSLTLHAGGQAWLVDPGTFVYTADYAKRNRFRSTAAHNTIMVAGEEQNRFAPNPAQIFQLQEDARPVVLRWEPRNHSTLFVGEHYGYGRLPTPVVHRRTIYYDGAAAVWLLQDELPGWAGQEAVAHFHFAPGLAVERASDRPMITATNQRGDQLTLLALTPGAIPTLTTGWVSPGYGVKTEAAVVNWPWSGEAMRWAIWLPRDEAADKLRLNGALDRLAQRLS